MPGSHSTENAFLREITQHILDNISNEQFGVSELADKTGMSRSNLLRKVKKLTNLSVSQFIRQVRLKEAMEMLRQGSYAVSEVAYKVGFSSVSYFIKCFGDVYGYPPGEVGKKELDELNSDEQKSSLPSDQVEGALQNIGDKSSKQIGQKNRVGAKWLVLSVLVLFLGFLVFYKDIFHISSQIFPSSRQSFEDKSIAVLPFINDSNDSTNVYIINGLMESILTNLQSIEKLRVVSRTSVEKYRNTTKTIPEIAKELNANYFIEGSGQKIGDKILLHIQLIESSSDKHLWAEQYNRDTRDIFSLQMEVAKNIADKIQVIITPAEEERMKKVPTTNLVAYDYFLKGLDLLNDPEGDKLEECIPYFKKAIGHDNTYARAYAAIGIAYYHIDKYQVEKIYSDSINYYADKALLYDAELPQSLIAKALYYMSNSEYELAVSYLEKTLEFNSNSDLAYLFLIDLYVHHLPNTEKYLEYALKGQQLDIEAYDSMTRSYSLLHLSNAFIQSGFVKEAEQNIYKSLDYFPGNLYSEYVKAYIIFAKDENLHTLKESLLVALSKDSTRLDIMQEVGKAYYYIGDYKSALKYYDKFVHLREAYNLDIYASENAKIALVYEKMGRTEQAEKFFKAYLEYAKNDPSIYKHFSLAAYYSYKGESTLALKHLEIFAEQDNYHYWTILFSPIDPLLKNGMDMPEFKKVFKKIETKFWSSHKKIKSSLKKEDLL